jgi:hypothetical protein
MRLRDLGVIAICFVWTVGSDSVEPDQTCSYGLYLHGRGQWGKALEHFTNLAVSNFQGSVQGDDFDIVDCIYGAALSLNALGMYDASLSAFRLSQRLQGLHPAGAAALAAESQQSCREYAVRCTNIPFTYFDPTFGLGRPICSDFNVFRVAGISFE